MKIKLILEQLDNEQKDELIGYYNKEICDKKEYVKKLKEKVKGKRGLI